MHNLITWTKGDKKQKHLHYTVPSPLPLGCDLFSGEGIGIVCDLQLAGEDNDGIAKVQVPFLHSFHLYPLQEQPLSSQVILKVSTED